MYIIALINLLALSILIARRELPSGFPWNTSAVLGILLLLSGLHSGDISRAAGFVTLLASFIVASSFKVKVKKYFLPVAVLLTMFMVADAFRLTQTPDVSVTSNEVFEYFRRPYLLEHPNVKAAWLLLLSLSPVTLIGVAIAQSRGALLGYITALAAYITPRRYYALAFVAGVVVMSIAAAFRPSTFFWRLDAWDEGLQIFLSHPLIGVGSGNYKNFSASGMPMAHNAALTIAAENGLIGLAAFAVWIIPVAGAVVRSKNIAKYNLLAFAVQQIVDDQWLHPISAILIGVVLAVCLNSERT